MTGFFDLPTWAIIVIIFGVVTLVSVAVIGCLHTFKNGDIMINKNGVIVKARAPRRISTKQFVNFMKEVITYVEDEKERYVDDIIGIKNRYYRQSKEFAKSRIDSVMNGIIEAYKLQYMAKYSGRLHPTIQNENGELIIETTAVLPTKEQLSGDKVLTGPCQAMCSGGCNSGLSFFDSRLRKDFRPLIEDVNAIIEANHLINRADREYEEEIITKAEQLSSHLKNKVVSYPVPIDNTISKDVIEKKTPELKEAIADSLRRSRTLSQKKRDVINQEKEKYYRRRDTQIAQIINVIDDADLSAILKRTDRRVNDNDDDIEL